MTATYAVLAHARAVPAAERARLAARLREEQLRGEQLRGSVLIETCHRVELYTAAPPPADLLLPSGALLQDGPAAVRHLVRLAVGRDSAVVGEDQLLHQLRQAVSVAREREPLAPGLDRLFDAALRAGRRARSWLPPRRASLAELALERVLRKSRPPAGPVLVVGAGEMGRRAALALVARGATVTLASRTPERAAAVATQLGLPSSSFDPGPATLAESAGVVLALAGQWSIDRASTGALVASQSWVIDLSAPGALPAELADALGRRLLTIDDLAGQAGPPPSEQLLERLDALVEETVVEYEAWLALENHRQAAQALAEKALAAQLAELNALWQRMPSLEPAERKEVERMARHLTERLLRDPLERLHDDRDGRHTLAARELFRL